MIKLITPRDIILREAEEDEVVKDIIENINNLLSKEEEAYSYSYKVKTSEPLTKKEEHLLEKMFLFYGWSLTIHTKLIEKDVFEHNFLIIPSYSNH